MLVTPKFVNLPKEGKKFGNIKGQDDSVFWFKRDAFQFNKGQTYDIRTESQKWGDNQVQVITEVVLADKSNAAHQPQPPSSPSATGAGGAAPVWANFVSNQVAHAIAAGRIDDPEQIKVWAAAAKTAFMELL